MPEIHVIKIGGSILSPNAQNLFNYAYAASLRKFLIDWLGARGMVICVGGGYLARKSQQDAVAHGESDKIDLHKIGVAATNLNAELLHAVLSDIAVPEVLRYDEYTEFVDGGAGLEIPPGKVLIASAAIPGRSNDWNAMELATKLGVNTVIDIKNVDGVYSANPKDNPEAKFLPKLTWQEYLDIIGNPDSHEPGASYPIDPLTARAAADQSFVFKVIGSELKNIQAALENEEFTGTIIS